MQKITYLCVNEVLYCSVKKTILTRVPIVFKFFKMAAEKGNKYAIGNSGRAKTYNSPEELKADIQDYFDYIENHPHKKLFTVTGKGEKIYEELEKPYTVEGLCLKLGISRQTLLNYRRKAGYEEYFDIILWATTKINERMISLGLIREMDSSLVRFILSNNTEYKQKTEDETKGILRIKWDETKTYDSEPKTNTMP